MDTRHKSAARFTAILVGGALASKLLGFAREIMMAHVLGASLVADGFRGSIAAVLIPLGFLQNESVPAIMIPMHRQALKGNDGPRSLGALTLVIGLIAFLLMIAVQLLGDLWVDAIVGGFSLQGRSITLMFVRIMAIGMPASAVLNVLAAGEIALGLTRLTNVRASLLNVSALGGIALFLFTGDVRTFAWSFTIAFNVLALWGVISLCRTGLLSFSGITLAFIATVGLEFFRRLRFLFVLPLAEQANFWFERLVASRITTGAVASLDYARTLTDSAVLLISQPIGMAVLSTHPPKDARAQVEAIARPLLALGLPATVFLMLFADDIVRLIFFRGAFGNEALLLTSQSLRGSTLGLWAATLAWILIRILNGEGRNFLAALIIVSGYAVNIAINLVGSSIKLDPGTAMLVLGVGEATRSIVLLTGVVAALQGRRKILGLIALGFLPALLMLGLGMVVRGSIDGSIERLLLGSLAYLISVVCAAELLLPAACAAAANHFRRKMRLRGSSV